MATSAWRTWRVCRVCLLPALPVGDPAAVELRRARRVAGRHAVGQRQPILAAAPGRLFLRLPSVWVQLLLSRVARGLTAFDGLL